MIAGLAIIAVFHFVVGGLVFALLGLDHAWLLALVLGMAAPVVIMTIRILPMISGGSDTALPHRAEP